MFWMYTNSVNIDLTTVITDHKHQPRKIMNIHIVFKAKQKIHQTQKNNHF